MRKRLAIGGIASLMAAAVLLSVSPASCGCETPLMNFGWQLGMFEPPEYAGLNDMTIENIQRAASKKFLGTPLAKISPPAALREGDCKKVGFNELDCSYWIESGMLREEGRLIKFRANANGTVEKIEVRNLRRWFKGTTDVL